MIDIVHAFILGIVEGLTEFIPVSSTGHLNIVGHLLGFEGERASTFEIFIQPGAILSVVFLYRERFLSLIDFRRSEGFAGLNGLTLLFFTTLPALILGLAVHDFIKHYLFHPTPVAIGLGIGGLAILLIERFLPDVKKSGLDSLNWKDALAIGLFQCLAMWLGISRSPATILGAMTIGIHRRTAAEYSFLAAVPVMFAATAFDLYKSQEFLRASDIPVFGVGFLVSFFSALLAIKTFIHLVGNHTLVAFGWYRLALVVMILYGIA